jgi:site-specific recombinase XerD
MEFGLVHMIIIIIECTCGMIAHMYTETRALVPTTRQPDLGRIKALVLDSVTSVHTRRAYDKALNDFLAWCLQSAPGEFTKATVQRYARRLEEQGLAASTINVRLTAVRRLAAEASDNGLIEPGLAAGISRVKGAKQQGTRTGNWLTVDQAESFINAPDTSQLKGRRDRALLAVLIGCGLRRSEVSDLTFEHIQQRDGRWAIVDLHGKGNRIRTAPMPSWTKAAIDGWSEAAQITHGRVFRPMNNRRQVSGDVLLPQNIMEAVAKYGKEIGVPKLAPHDLRRTFAKLAHKGRAALEQIQLSLGHASIVTTERYLGVRQDLQDAPCDHLGIRIPAA